MQKKEKCSINTSSVLKQIINERDSPLSIFREAISNSFDANANKMEILAKEDDENQIDIIFKDDGDGMNLEELEQFFNAGYTSKDETKIGEKKKKKIQVKTKKEEKSFKGILKNPVKDLKNGKIPQYEIKSVDDINISQGTEIILKGLKTNNKRDIFWGNKFKNYLRWKTAAGSIRRFFEDEEDMEVQVEVSNNKNKSYTIKGHPLPETNDVEDPDAFAYRFDPFEYEIETSSGTSKIQVIGSIVGSEAHVVKDKRMKKKYKGFFLCKDYFPIRSVNEEVFGNSGEWQSMHVLINCQDLELTMGREDFVNKNEEGSVFNRIIDSLKTFKNSILNGEPFHWNTEMVENTECYAGKGYELKQSIKHQNQNDKREIQRATKIIQKKKNIEQFENQEFPFAFKPSNRLSTFSLFMTLLGKELLPKDYKIFDVDEEGDKISILMAYSNGSELTEPKYYTVYKNLNNDLLNKLNGGYQGVICWDANDLSVNSKSELDDIIQLKNLV